MSDEARTGCQPEGANHQPLSIPMETPQWFLRTSAPCLSAAWLQPLVPTLVVQPNSRTAVALNYLPPHTSLVQPPLRRDEPSQIPQPMSIHSSIPAWGMTGNITGPFLRPIVSEYCSVEQWHAHLPPAASHQRAKVTDAPADTQETRRINIVHPGREQPQDNNMPTLEIPNRARTAALSLVSSQTLSKGPIDLCAVEDEGAGTLGAQKPDSSVPVQSIQVMETKTLPMSTGAKPGELEKGILNPTEVLKRDLETEKLPLKKRWRKRKMADQASPTEPKIKVHIPNPQPLKPKEKALEVKASGSKPKGLPTEKKTTEPKKAQAPKVATAKNKAQAKPCTGPLKTLPKNNPGLRLKESVQIFYPLGEKHVSTMPVRKGPTNTSSNMPPFKPAFTATRPVPKALPMSVPKPLGNPTSSTLTKPKPPASLPKPPSSLAKPTQIPVFVQPAAIPKPQPTALQKGLPNVVGRTSALESRHTITRPQNQRPGHMQVKGPIRTMLNFCPRTVPRDHGLVLNYPKPPPALPFELAFRNWRPPSKDLQVSIPITEEQRPRREMMKRQAQREREEAARWTSLGRVQFFAGREKEKETSIMFGYP
ncbi:uncharacterized protein C2orf78 homolog [Paroedura picta]|uniref:uncharacterized protein C2orf78 homolog n=1 Tax=Paroedura picta TaxID=143630 RepID=UPI004056C10D